MPTEGSAISGLQHRSAINSVSLQPVFNQLHSLGLLYKEKLMPGLGEWVAKTRESMNLEQLQRNRLVMEGLCYAFTTEADLPSFGAYLDRLESFPPMSFQDRLLSMYLKASPTGCSMEDIEPPSAEERKMILSSVDSYHAFLLEHFEPANVDLDLEAQAYRYVMDPPAMKTLIIGHLREMWETLLAPEWARVRPMLAKAVDAFHRSGFSAMGRREAIRFVIGREIPDMQWEGQIDQAEQVILAPSAHVGPYLGKFTTGKTLIILFGARLPEGAAAEVPDLSRTEILTRLDALADDHRLRILRMAMEAAEVRATDVMSSLDISQSAASRNLTQLTANGYLAERRRDGGKSYSLNPARIQDTLVAICRFLGLPEGLPPKSGE
jgi:DNA-binding transcriptional ArsR family regulator